MLYNFYPNANVIYKSKKKNNILLDYSFIFINYKGFETTKHSIFPFRKIEIEFWDRISAEAQYFLKNRKQHFLSK